MCEACTKLSDTQIEIETKLSSAAAAAISLEATFSVDL